MARPAGRLNSMKRLRQLPAHDAPMQGPNSKRVRELPVDDEHEDFSADKERRKAAKYTPRSPLTDVKGLFSTGLLEGFSVTYKFEGVEVNGFIKDLGYQCGCSSCNYTEVVSALKFEKHAGVTTTNQNNHIFLDNGITVYKLVKNLMGKCVDLGSLDEVIEDEIHCPPNMEQFEWWKASFTVNGNGVVIATDVDKTRHSCPNLYAEHDPVRSFRENGCPVTKETNHIALGSENYLSPCSTLIKKSNRPQRWFPNDCSLDDYIPSKKQQVRSFVELTSFNAEQKDHEVVGIGVNLEGKEISYNQRKISKHAPSSYISDVKGLLSTGILEGLPVTYKKDEGEIHGIISGVGYRCGCSSCNYTRVLSALEFEKHAGVTSKNQNDHVYLDSGISMYKLVKCLKDKHVELGSLDKVIKEVVQIRPNMEHFENWKASFGMNVNQKEIITNVDETQIKQPEIHTAHHSVQGFIGVAIRSSTNPAPIITMKSRSSGPLEECFPSLNSCVSSSSRHVGSATGGNVHLTLTSDRNSRSFGLVTESNDAPTSNVCMKPSISVPTTNGTTYVASSLNWNSSSSRPDMVGITNSILAMKNSPLWPAKEIALTTPRFTLESSSSLRPAIDCGNGPAPIITMKPSSFRTDTEASAHLVSNVTANVCSNSGIEVHNNIFPIMVKPLSSGPPTEGSGVVVSKVTSSYSSSSCPATEDDIDPALAVSTKPGSSVPDAQESAHLFSSLASSRYTDSDLLSDDSCIKQLQSLSILDGQSQLSKRVLPSPDLLNLSGSNGSQLTRKVTNQGGLKRRDSSLHQLIFKENGLPDGSKLAYCVKGKTKKTGYKLGNGIMCDCCNKEMRPSQFESHAGFGQRRQPYRHIYTSDGITLHELSIALFNSQSLTPSCSEVSCAICGTGGELVCCDGCTKSFHTVCLELQSEPGGEWCCPYCIDLRSRSGYATRSSGAIRSIMLRSRLTLKAETDQFLCCTLCKDGSFILNAFDAKTVIFCTQCEREYHIGCLKDHGVCDLQEVPMECKWFCCADCDSIHATLQKLVNDGENSVPRCLSSIIKKKSLARDLADDLEAHVHWQILSGKYVRDKLLLDKTIGLFQESFYPIVEGGQDLLTAMVHAKDAAGKLLEGVYCAIITVKSLVVSACVFRVFGRKIAELPLVATRKRYRGKGYFRIIFSLVELILCHLKVECLIVPASKDVRSLWMEKLGFVELAEEKLQAHLKDYPLMMFEMTTMLEKAVPRSLLMEDERGFPAKEWQSAEIAVAS